VAGVRSGSTGVFSDLRRDLCCHRHRDLREIAVSDTVVSLDPESWEQYVEHREEKGELI